MASQVYYAGDFWNCIEDAAVGESPGTNPEKWVKLTIPLDFEPYLGQATYARLLPGEGQNDRRLVEERIAEGILYETWFRETQQSGRVEPSRSKVHSR